MQAIREKPHRLPKEYYKGRIFVALTLCIQNRAPIFSDAEIVKIFIDLLAGITTKHNCQIPVYCFMPDHLHFIIVGNDDEVDLLRAVASYKQKTGYWMSRNKPSARWQKDFYDHVIKKEESFSAWINYILDNPVRRGIVKNWLDYPFKGSIGIDFNEVISSLY
jgi:REP element-mobilizing transposase RayT